MNYANLGSGEKINQGVYKLENSRKFKSGYGKPGKVRGIDLFPSRLTPPEQAGVLPHACSRSLGHREDPTLKLAIPPKKTDKTGAKAAGAPGNKGELPACINPLDFAEPRKTTSTATIGQALREVQNQPDDDAASSEESEDPVEDELPPSKSTTSPQRSSDWSYLFHLTGD